MEENQPESVAAGGGGLATNVSTLIEGVGPCSFAAAASDRLRVPLNISSSAACPGDLQATPQSTGARTVGVFRNSWI